MEKVSTGRAGWGGVVAVVALAGVLLGVWWGYGLVEEGGWGGWLVAGLPEHLGDFPPLYGHARAADFGDGRVWVRLAGAVAMMAVVLVGTVWGWGRVGHLAGTRGRLWRAVWLAGAVVGVVMLNSAVAQIRGGSASFVKPFERKGLEYFWDVRLVGDDVAGFVRSYAGERRRDLSHHARTHPPGGVVFLWVGSRVFGGSVLAASGWAVAFSGLGVVLVYWIGRMVLGAAGGAGGAGESGAGGSGVAGDGAPLGWVVGLYAVAPSCVLFGATCMDSAFAVFLLLSIGAALWALRAGGRWSTAGAVGLAGVAFWLAAFMTYAAVMVPVLMAMYWLVGMSVGVTELRWGRVWWRVLAIGAVATGCQVLAGAWGYDFWGVAHAAMERDLAGLGKAGRFEGWAMWGSVTVGNVFAWALGSGVGLAGLAGVGLVCGWKGRERALAVSVAVLGTVVLMGASGLFTLETERVWMFLTPLAVVGAAGMVAGQRGGRAMLRAAAALMALQTVVVECQFNTLW